MPNPSPLIPTLLLLALTPGALAQDAEPASPTEIEPPARSPFRIQGRGYVLDDTDLDDGGSVSAVGGGLRLDGRLPLDAHLALDVGLAYGFDAFDFSGDEGFAALDPWGDVHSAAVRVVLNARIDDEWAVFGGPLLGFAAEDGAVSTNALRYGGQFGARYRPDETLSLGFGVTIFTRLDDDPLIIPLLFFDWKFAEDWTLRTGNFDIGSEGGPGLELAWRVAEEWELALGAVYERRRFRLDDEGVAPDGLGRYEAIPVYGKVTWRPAANVELSGSVGVTATGELRLEDDDGDRLTDDDLDAGLVVGARLTFRF